MRTETNETKEGEHGGKQKKRPAPWRILLFLLSMAFIVYLWSEKDIAAIYAEMPAEQVAPLVITTLAVTLLKVAVIPLSVFLLKRIFGRERSKKSVHR